MPSLSDIPANRSRLVALCAAATDTASASARHALPLADLIPAAGRARLHCLTLAGGIADAELAEVAHLALAATEYLENALAVRAERERARRAAVAAAMQGAA